MTMQSQELLKLEDIWDLEALFPAQNLKACHLPEDGRAFVIEDIDPRHVVKVANEPDKVLPAIILRGEPLPFVLNKTNVRLLASVYGKRAATWLGRPIVLFSTQCQGKEGKPVDCIRVHADKTRAASMAPLQALPSGVRVADEIEVAETSKAKRR